MEDRTVSLLEAKDYAKQTLMASNVSAENAEVVAAALVAAEADGLKGHGLSRLPSYCAQARSGKVAGHAVPAVDRPKPAVVRVDAKGGFAYPAIQLGIDRLRETAKQQGVGLLGINNSNHAGVAGHHVEALANHGLVALMFANTPAAIAPWGGSRAIFGTNPIAFAAPRPDGEPAVVDLSVSKVARGNIMAAAQKGDLIPEGWALDSAGQPTTDAASGLKGTMVPLGDAKGTALAFMVEILAATLVGANHSFDASSFFDGDGDPPGTGQLFIAIDPATFGSNYNERLQNLIDAIGAQQGTRIPGERRVMNRRRAEKLGVTITAALQQAVANLGQ